MVAPFIELTLGDMFNNTPGYIDGVTVTPQDAGVPEVQIDNYSSNAVEELVTEMEKKDEQQEVVKEEEKVIKTLDKSEILPPKVLPTPPELIKEEPKIQPYNIDHNDYMNYLIYKSVNVHILCKKNMHQDK